MMTVMLGGKSWEVVEPVFRDLKKIIAANDKLANPLLSPEHPHLIMLIIRLLLPTYPLDKPWWWRLANWRTYPSPSADELNAFIAAIPALCGLSPSKSVEPSGADPWGEIYAHVAASVGYTFEELDSTMTLSRLDALSAYWQKHPPVHLLKAAELGYEYKEKQSVKAFFDSIAGSMRR